MDFLDKELVTYIEAHSAEEMPVLKELDRATHLNVMRPRMLSGHIQGNVLQLLSWMIRPRHILEIGTYTGYSAICLAQGLQEGGILHTIDINEELEDMVKKYLKQANIEQNVKLHIGNAVDIVPTLDETFDLVFIDADKANYSTYFDLVIDKVRPNGFIIADNVLWSGNVLTDKDDKETRGIIDFNKKVHNDKRVFHTIFGVRDGLMVIRKLAN